MLFFHFAFLIYFTFSLLCYKDCYCHTLLYFIFNQLAKEKNDPEKRETLIQKLTPHVKVLTDECGNDYKLVRICDLNLPLDGFIKDDKVMFRDIKTTALRDDDVMLLNYPKTGVFFSIFIIVLL